MPREIDVTCPCCSTRLTVDVSTAQVLRQVRAEDRSEGATRQDRWESAQERVRSRTQSAADKLDSALEYERTKEARFDDLLDKAKAKHKPRDEE